MALYAFIALQLAAALGGFVFLLRRIEKQDLEIAALRARLEAKAAPRARRAAGAKVVSIAPDVEPAIVAAPSAWARAAQAWRSRALDAEKALQLSTLSPETGRLLALAAMAAAPAIGFLFAADASATVTSGLSIAAAMMMVALRPNWSGAAWASVIAGAAWAATGFVLGIEPISFSLCLTLTAVAGLIHAHLRRAAPGAAMTLLMAATTLALGGQLGMIGAGGVAFGVIVAAAAAVGALSLRLEALTLSAFGAGLIGLFVLTGQESAAIWFTPAIAWFGVWFFAIGIIRIPQLGAQGGALAGTAALGPIVAAGGLHLSEHGLADPLAAAGAFAMVSACLSGLIAVAALRDRRGVGELGLTLWILALGAFFSVTSALVIALPAVFAAPAFALLAVALVALDVRVPDPTWRAFACAASIFATANAWSTAQTFFDAAPHLPGILLVAIGIALPAALAGGCAYLAQRNDARKTAGVLEASAIFMGVLATSLTVRSAMSGGVPALHVVSFVEAGVHAALWLTAGLALAMRATRGAAEVRHVAVVLLSGAAFAVCAVSAIAWLTPFWMLRVPDVAIMQHQALGFALPAALAWLHYVFWRGQGQALRTRVAFAAAGMLTACFIALEVAQARSGAAPGQADWVSFSAAAVAFAVAVGLNFAPFVVDKDVSPQLDLEEYLQRDGRRQERG
ncbi:hypothetical protein [Terricaulis sp.]|uniref:hypothetical protein n=1 Tax=Terricaulis sp. TaxID=2768686 RepID=UPI003783778F